MPGSYFGTYGLGPYPNIGYGQGFIGSGTNWYPISNNWYMPGNQAYPYNYQFGYHPQQYPYLSNYGYMNWPSTYSTGQSGTFGFRYQDWPRLLAYIGQSYVPSNEWLPLPGVNRRRQSRQRSIVPNTNDNRALSTRK
ncbi:unnamed protein product [Rotaria sp. Silwood1]|nr:unnamed protein product [Rotaria sp. Silwood1]CAF3514260.1 unnamed protein product [Rotaria sp. Silwood1]CAF4751987.1 unnamed protein product [Rotaria sp. Silwood1]CAF4941789.1 unnamed protein product [Rotaria sp. Silwood1]